jgi:hypothetical protein
MNFKKLVVGNKGYGFTEEEFMENQLFGKRI